MELFYWLLFTLPGSPVLYYGDEIGMGDNVHLGDRDSVRTPMQWTGDRNAGFSQAAPEALYLPVISDPVYGYQAVNVESQRQNGGSLLRWLSHILSVRREHPQLAIGSFTPVPVENPAVFAYIRGGRRREAPDPILCIANLHRQAQPAAIPLPDHVGARPLELLGDVPFPDRRHRSLPRDAGLPRLPRLRAATRGAGRTAVNVARPAHAGARHRPRRARGQPGGDGRLPSPDRGCARTSRPTSARPSPPRRPATATTAFTCATPREMVGMAAAGLGGDLLLANEVLDPDRLGAMAAAARRRRRRADDRRRRQRGDDRRRRRGRASATCLDRRRRRAAPLRLRARRRRRPRRPAPARRASRCAA